MSEKIRTQAVLTEAEMRQALEELDRKFPKLGKPIKALIDILMTRIQAERNEGEAAFVTLKAAILELNGHMWACPFSTMSRPDHCTNVSCRRVQELLAHHSIPSYLARAFALESLVQHHVRHDPLCPKWQRGDCVCGLDAMVQFFAEAGGF